MLRILKAFLQSLISVAQSDERIEVVRKQAAFQSTEYQRLLKEKTGLESKLKELQGLEKDQLKSTVNQEALLKQSEGLRAEYDRLAEKYSELEKKLKHPLDSKKDQ